MSRSIYVTLLEKQTPMKYVPLFDVLLETQTRCCIARQDCVRDYRKIARIISYDTLKHHLCRYTYSRRRGGTTGREKRGGRRGLFRC